MMNTETIVLALTLALSVMGTGAALYGRLVKIETAVRLQSVAIAKIFRRLAKLPHIFWRVRSLEERVGRMEGRCQKLHAVEEAAN